SALVTSGAGCVLIPKDGFYKAVEIVDCQDIKPQRVAVIHQLRESNSPAIKEALAVGKSLDLVIIFEALSQFLCLGNRCTTPTVLGFNVIQDSGQGAGLIGRPKAEIVFAGGFHNPVFTR